MSAATRLWAACVLAKVVAAEVFFEERFETEAWEQRWVHSTSKGPNGPAGQFEWSAGTWPANEKAQKGLRTPKNMHYYGISSKLEKPFSNKGKDLVVQFSVKHEEHKYSFCGGGYIKLLGSEFDQVKFGGDTPYKIMFGPDICGSDVARIHLIFNWKGKNLLRTEDIKLDYDDKNEFTHLYTLVLKPDDTYKVYMDLKEKASGTLYEHWDFPKKSHDDPKDSKPSDWVEEAKIDDPAAKKPADWVDERRIRDPTAQKPEEWDDDEDGVYEAPLIDNPAYKGAWSSGKVDNPAYKGVWKAKQIPNPDFVEGVYGYDDIGAVGFELWTVNLGSIFDNILLTDSFDHAKAVAEEVWKPHADEEKATKKAWEKKSGKAGSPEFDDADGGEEDDDDEAAGDDKVEL
eukprot:TRINITY_DN30812_c0_g1_i1.p1 TRINITY_DN30812_c0_g1~~TRINITY_DN30812_c0_g1_i1.p1  ORF type:complete len:401 (-),score=139.24 TRINITY_DN30812_c0_g1_i1:111-1313(-)